MVGVSLIYLGLLIKGKVDAVIFFGGIVNLIVLLFTIIWDIMGIIAYFGPEEFQCDNLNGSKEDVENMTLAWIVFAFIGVICGGIMFLCLFGAIMAILCVGSGAIGANPHLAKNNFLQACAKRKAMS